MARAPFSPFYPYAAARLAALAAPVEGGQGPDDPFLQTGDVGAHVRPSPFQVQHHIGDPLAGAVIGELAAAAGLKHREAGVEQIAGPAAGAGGVERRGGQGGGSPSSHPSSPAWWAAMSATRASISVTESG